MNVLVDHGWHLNLGDAAQVEGAVLRLLALFPDVIVTTFFENSPSQLWQNPRIARRSNYALHPFLRPISTFLLGENAVPATSRLFLPFLNAPLWPGAVRVSSGSEVCPADEFCRPFDAFYIPGGGFLTDVFQKDLARKCLLMLTFAAQGKPVILTGQQLGPFRFSPNKSTFLRTLHKVNFVGLREPLFSPRYCQEAGLPASRYDVMGDDSFGIEPAEDAIVEQVLDHYDLVSQRFIAFNVRMAQNYAGTVETYLKPLCQMYDFLAEKTGFPLFFVPISLDPVEGEQVTAKRLQQWMKAPFSSLEEPYLTPAVAKGVLGRAWGAVGVSYHFCTFTLSQGKPAVCLFAGDYYNQKGRGICEFWGDDRLALSLRDLNPVQAAQDILAFFEDEVYREQLAYKSVQVVSEWRDTFDRVQRQVLG